MARLEGNTVRWGKKDLINQMYERGYTKRASTVILTDLFSIIRNALIEGIDVDIQGIGTIKTKLMPERTGRNLFTGEKVVVPPHRSPRMRFSASFRNDIRRADEASD